MMVTAIEKVILEAYYNHYMNGNDPPIDSRFENIPYLDKKLEELGLKIDREEK